MAMLRLWAPTLCTPRRCSVSDTVPMRRTTTGSLLRKKPSRKGGSCRHSRLPWGRWLRWDRARGPAALSPLDPHPPGHLHGPRPLGPAQAACSGQRSPL